MIRVSGVGLSRRLARRPAAPRAGSFSYRPVFEHWDGELAAVERELATAEDAYVHDKLRLVGLRQDRDEAGSSLYGEQMRLQGLLGALLEPGVLGAAGIAGSVPQGGIELVRRVECMVWLVRDLGSTGRWPLAWVGVDAGVIAGLLEEGRRELVAARRGLEQGRQASVALRCRADERVAEVDTGWCPGWRAGWRACGGWWGSMGSPTGSGLAESALQGGTPWQKRKTLFR